MHQISIYLEPEQHEILKKLSRVTSVPMSELIRAGVNISLIQFCWHVFRGDQEYVKEENELALQALWFKFMKHRSNFTSGFASNLQNPKSRKTQ